MVSEYLLTSENLSYRPLTATDADGLFSITNDFDVVKMTATWPWPVTREYVASRLEETALRPQDRTTGLGIFCDDTLAGSMGGHIEAHHETGEEAIWIGYMLGRPWWGSGLMTEALGVLCPYLWQRLGELDIYGEHFSDNPASGLVMVKAGFAHVGAAPLVWSKARQRELPGEQYRRKAHT